MAGLFIKTISLLKTTKITSVNRTTLNLNYIVAGLKQDTKDLLKQLNVPDKPKKPLSPYIKFCQSKRTEILKNNPNLAQTELLKKCAEAWKNIDVTLKEKLKQDYTNEYENYTVQYNKYLSGLSPEQQDVLLQAKEETANKRKRFKIRKANRELNKPKRPLTAITRYRLDRSKELNVPFSDLLKKDALKWDEVPADVRKKYENEYQKDRERYHEELKLWEERMVNEGREDLIRKTVVKDNESKSTRRSSSTRRSKPVREE